MSHIRTDSLAMGIVGILAYSLLAYFSTATSLAQSMPSLGVTIALLPIVAALVWMIWQQRGRIVALTSVVIGLGLLAMIWSSLERNFAWLYFLQNIGANLFLAWLFGQSLFGDKSPMCTQFASAVHQRPLSAEEIVYTRQVTWVWALFFLLMVATSSILFLFAPLSIWSFFINFMTFPLIAGLFLIEYLVRLRRLPESRQFRLMDSVLIYWQSKRD